MNYEKAKKLAEEHWKWLESWLHIVYVDAFIHGYKHGCETYVQRDIEKYVQKKVEKQFGFEEVEQK